MIVADPHNKTVVIGEWVNVSCDVMLNSPMEAVLWFVNDSTLSSQEISDFGFSFKSNIFPHSNLSTSRHILLIQPNMQCNSTATVYCAIVSACSRASVMGNCTPSVCFSEIANIESIYL